MYTTVLQTLAKVVCSVMKFDEEQTRKVLEREDSRREVCPHLCRINITTTLNKHTRVAVFSVRWHQIRACFGKVFVWDLKLLF